MCLCVWSFALQQQQQQKGRRRIVCAQSTISDPKLKCLSNMITICIMHFWQANARATSFANRKLFANSKTWCLCVFVYANIMHVSFQFVTTSFFCHWLCRSKPKSDQMHQCQTLHTHKHRHLPRRMQFVCTRKGWLRKGEQPKEWLANRQWATEK